MAKPIVVDFWRRCSIVCKVSVGRLHNGRLLIVFGDNHQEHITLLEEGAQYATRGKKFQDFQKCGGNSINPRATPPYFLGLSFGLGDIPSDLKEIVIQEFIRLYPL